VFVCGKLVVNVSLSLSHYHGWEAFAHHTRSGGSSPSEDFVVFFVFALAIRKWRPFEVLYAPQAFALGHSPVPQQVPAPLPSCQRHVCLTIVYQSIDSVGELDRGP
jgi:hypothetical protein